MGWRGVVWRAMAWWRAAEQEIKWAYTALDEVLPTDVHMAMVIPALRYQTSPEQRERWLPLATSFRILAAYVQTELGHGSNVRALETTATFDKVCLVDGLGFLSRFLFDCSLA